MAASVTANGKRDSIMKARVPSSHCGDRSDVRPASYEDVSGPCGAQLLCKLAPPTLNCADLPSWRPEINARNSATQLRWKPGGRKVRCATTQRGGRIINSAFGPATPSDGDVRAQK